jgi:ribosomal-protein-alanine N-acetyltransferase
VSGATVRPLRWQDLAEVVALEAELFPDDPWSAAGWWAELAQRPRRDYVVLTQAEAVDADGGEPAERGIAGYAGLDLAGETADVMTVAVHPRLRGTGRGATLLRALLDRARAAGAGQVMLEVRADNEAALALYQRHGFEVVHTRRGYYQPGGVDALVMRAVLGTNGAVG